MKKYNYLIAFLMLIISYSSLNAQFEINGEFRSRFQRIHGQNKPVKEDVDGIMGFDQRSRVIFDYKNENIVTKFTIQDARVWGSENLYNASGIFGNTNSLEIYEAWAELKLKGNSYVKIGRQEWNYHDIRLISKHNWWTTGMTYDGILYKYANKDKGLCIDFGISYNAEGANNGTLSAVPYVDKIKTLNFLNIQKSINDNSYFALMSIMTGKEDYTRNVVPLLVKGTHGLYFSLNEGKKADKGITANLSAFYQHGTDMARTIDGLGYKQVASYMVATQVGYRTTDSKFEFLVGVELLSGNDGTNTEEEYNNVEHNFDLFYGARFPHWGGNMNYYINSTSTKGGGFFDPFVKLNIKTNKKGTFGINVWLPQTYTQVYKELNTNLERVYYEKGLGYNFDLSYTHKFSQTTMCKVGMSYAVISDTKNHMTYGYKDVTNQTLHTLGQNYFFYTMLSVNLNYFKTKKEE